MVIKVTKSLTFIPEFNGNKEAASSEQIVVHFKNPTYNLKEKIKGRPETKARADINGNIEGMDIVLKTNDVALVRGMLERIDNCQYEDDKGTVNTISNASELFEAPVEFSPLIDEIVAEFNRVMNKTVPEKN